MEKKVTIIGAGNGGFAAAADLTLGGYQVTLYHDEARKKTVEELMKTNTIELTGVKGKEKVKIYKVTTNMKDAMAESDIIMSTIPAYGQEYIANKMLPYLRKEHKIILTPGSTGGALVMAKIFYEKGKFDGVKIAEMHTLPYACRKTSPTGVKILLECKKLYFAAFPAKYNEEMYKIVKKMYPAVELIKDVLETSLNNGNPVSHPAPVVLNAGKIEYSKGEHYHYREGITPSVARVNQKIDLERQEICKLFGYKAIDIKDRLYLMGYAPKRETLYECYRDSEVFNPLKGPKDLNDRYLTEDTPYSLVALASIAHKLGIKTPVMDSVITLASALKDEEYWENGRTFNDLGFEGMDLEKIKDFLQNGYE
ncbi:NAD/NADP-dependent octopine/nopaline dehydrogenase family protein [Tepidibacter formicigenes]|jgi:opine dehydrogenase|uniref:Opine dehydrogenase n=1 Tax=Tepidibacter formicigenes DSM 15518 TaxID=1123349 RepID=A0A1M6U2U1_9FIRM|nr:NAD/NADP octopine/nopaline dehydrogenase family protein [Tepidibacter formicigenes]SHK63592.1 opine dehydrogenase [Tepidibacter formicigenes DSM 15518]